MLDAIMGFITGHPYLNVFLLSMVPIIELRGGMIAAVTMLQLPLIPSYVVCVVGNILPVPILLLFAKTVLGWCIRIPKIGPWFGRFWTKAEINAKKIGKWELLGLMIFVAIPLPGSGAWTGTLIASVLRLKTLPAFFSIALGVLIAGVIMGFASFGLLGAVRAMFA